MKLLKAVRIRQICGYMVVQFGSRRHSSGGASREQVMILKFLFTEETDCCMADTPARTGQ